MSTTTTVVTISAAAAHIISRETAAVTDGCETGGVLLGVSSSSGVVLRHAGPPGPDAVRTPVSFLRDRRHAQQLADACWALDQSQWIGEWHTHPGMSPTPSERDLTTYRDLLTDPDLSLSVFVSLIVTPGANGAVIAGWWCTREGVTPVDIVIEGTR